MKYLAKLIGFLIYLPHILLFLSCDKKEIILRDLYARTSPNNKSLLYQLFALSSELINSRYFRTLFYFRTRGVFSKVLRVFYPRSETFVIDMDSIIGAGVKLAHPYATILNAESIGENLYVNHLVTVGEKNGKKPVIGNNVQLHAGAMVIGDIRIGDNVIVGAGAVVVKDVPNNATVVGNPSRIILR